MVKTKDKEKIKELEARVEELTNNWKRALADYSNLEKRIASERQNLTTFSKQLLIIELLPVLDNLVRAARNLKDEGLNLVVREFEGILQNFGVKEFGRTGENFDPNLHEVVAVNGSETEGKIIEVFSKGYKINDKMVRTAKVKVGQKR